MNEFSGDLVEIPAKDLITSGAFTGITGELTNEEYHSLPGLSFSGLKEFAKTPAHYQAYLQEERKETAAQRLGTLIHMAVLEPEAFATRVIAVEGSRNSKAVKAEIAEHEAAGLKVCNPDELETSRRVADSVRKNGIVKEILSGGQAEQSVFWKDAETQILMKCRPDYLRLDDGIVVDLKTFSDLSDSAIEKQIVRMKYHWQSAFYLNGVSRYAGRKLTMFAHLFVAVDPPYAARVVVLNDASLEKAEHEFAPLIASFAECLKTNHWPSYEQKVSVVSLPDWSW